MIGNDTDLEGQPLTATLGSTTPQHGTLVFNGNGSFTYTPNTNFVGVDSFTYTVSDGGAVSNHGDGDASPSITEIATQTVGAGGDRHDRRDCNGDRSDRDERDDADRG